MATETIKVLGQSAPAANVLTDAYTVPSSTSAAVSSLIICNRGTGYTNVRVSVAVAGVADNPTQYVYYDLLCDPNNTFIATVGITLSAADVVRVQSDTGQVTFQFYGTEVTP
jgi:hypothetical protein